MKFRTEYTPLRNKQTLDPAKPAALAGSCFSDNIASRMRSALWPAANSLGTLYNPVSIAKALELTILSGDPEGDFRKSLFEYNGYWNSRFFGSKFSGTTLDEAIGKFRQRAQEFRNALTEGKTLIVTFGTSWVFDLEDGTTVGNCHKLPASCFSRRRLSIEEIIGIWKRLLMKLQDKIQGLNVIFTVSPVRHLKDGFHGNSISKAILLLSTEEICRSVGNCTYFPAYEILNDDLRDYRFYASDLVHPSEEGIEYIWENFVKTFLDESGRETLLKGEKEFKRLNHRSILLKDSLREVSPTTDMPDS